MTLPHLSPPELANIRPPPTGRFCHTTRFPKKGRPKKVKTSLGPLRGWRNQTRKLINTNSGWAPKPWDSLVPGPYPGKNRGRLPEYGRAPWEEPKKKRVQGNFEQEERNKARTYCSRP